MSLKKELMILAYFQFEKSIEKVGKNGYLVIIKKNNYFLIMKKPNLFTDKITDQWSYRDAAYIGLEGVGCDYIICS